MIIFFITVAKIIILIVDILVILITQGTAKHKKKDKDTRLLLNKTAFLKVTYEI